MVIATSGGRVTAYDVHRDGSVVRVSDADLATGLLGTMLSKASCTDARHCRCFPTVARIRASAMSRWLSRSGRLGSEASVAMLPSANTFAAALHSHRHCRCRGRLVSEASFWQIGLMWRDAG